MPSPFPGMDPYLEDPGWWPDFHARFVVNCRHMLSDAVPDRYLVLLDVRDRYLRDECEGTVLAPGLVVDTGAPPPPPGWLRASVPMAGLGRVRDTRIQVLHGADRRLVSVVKFLSHFDKTGDGAGDYRCRRNELLYYGVNLVEVNLLADGERPPLASPYPAGDYSILVVRGGRRPRASVTCWTVRDVLLSIPVPLLSSDPDILLDLQTAFDLAYDSGRYRRVVNYSVPPAGPLSPADRAWAADRGRAATSSGHPPAPSP
jgi:Protein of unknown function (DUF4058)